MRRKRVIGFSAVVLVVLAAIVVATSYSCSNATPQSTKPTTQPTPSAPAPAGPPLSAARAQQVADALRSGDTGRITAAVVLPSGLPLPAGFVQQLHDLRSLNVAPDSVHNNVDGTASAAYIMVDSSGKTSTWQATLVEPNGTWLFAITTLEK